MSSRSAWISEFREVVWLASVVSGLSVLGVSMAVGLAFALDHWGSAGPPSSRMSFASGRVNAVQIKTSLAAKKSRNPHPPLAFCS